MHILCFLTQISQIFLVLLLKLVPEPVFLAKHIIDNYSIKSYTILDIERNISELKGSYLSDEKYSEISFITSGEYEKIFDKNYDLFVATQSLSETPDYYYCDIFNKISAENCFIVDEGTGPAHVFNSNSPISFNNTLSEWHSKSFVNVEGTHRNHDVQGHFKNGIMAYIGKNKRNP